jgi:hypothetical protein
VEILRDTDASGVFREPDVIIPQHQASRPNESQGIFAVRLHERIGVVRIDKHQVHGAVPSGEVETSGVAEELSDSVPISALAEY